MSARLRNVTRESRAECQRCTWRTAGAGALGNAAQHHDATAHAVTVDVETRIVYGDPSAAAEGQTTLEDLEP